MGRRRKRGGKVGCDLTPFRQPCHAGDAAASGNGVLELQTFSRRAAQPIQHCRVLQALPRFFFWGFADRCSFLHSCTSLSLSLSELGKSFWSAMMSNDVITRLLFNRVETCNVDMSRAAAAEWVSGFFIIGSVDDLISAILTKKLARTPVILRD